MSILTEKKFFHFVKKSNELFKNITKKDINQEIENTLIKKNSLRRCPREWKYDNVRNNYEFINKNNKCIKIKRINELYKWIIQYKHRCYFNDYKTNKFIKSGYIKALEIQVDIMELKFNLYNNNCAYDKKELFTQKKILTNTLKTLKKFIDNYVYQKYNILLVLQEKNIPNDLFRIFYSFIY
tara:strand:- start:1865 stop:2410 length:546 start_codon:yes stop_codon:yes gene_type:complete